MEKAQEIWKHLVELYGDTIKTESEVINWSVRNPEKYKAWSEAFADYDVLDIFKAIDEYWRFQSNKTKPTVAKLLAMLNTNKDVEKENKKELSNCKYFNIENQYMQRDKELGINQEYFLADYQRAVKYILTDRLVDLVGGFEFKKMSKDDKLQEYSEKYALAMKNGLFNDFDDVLHNVNPPRTVSKSKNVNDLVTAWKM